MLAGELCVPIALYALSEHEQRSRAHLWLYRPLDSMMLVHAEFSHHARDNVTQCAELATVRQRFTKCPY